nr:thioredoxin H4-1-like [Ipomoea batatas]
MRPTLSGLSGLTRRIPEYSRMAETGNRRNRSGVNVAELLGNGTAEDDDSDPDPFATSIKKLETNQRNPTNCWCSDLSRIQLLVLHGAVLDSGNEDEGNTGSAELAGGNVQLVTTMEKWEELISEANNNGQSVLVNFSASWCNPCRQAAPAYRELADKHTTEFSSSWDIKATPTFFFLKEGRQVDKLVGGSKQELEKRILAMAETPAAAAAATAS